MIGANNRRREPGKAGTDTALLVGAIAILGVLGVVSASVTVGSRLEHVNRHLPADPFAIATGLARGSITWRPSSSWCAAVLVALIAAAVFGMRALHRGGVKRRPVERAARYMAAARQLQHLQAKQALRHLSPARRPRLPGIPLGRLVAGGQMPYSSFEDMITVIAGPRVGESTSLVIPAITVAPGAVVTTSNKRDVRDAT